MPKTSPNDPLTGYAPVAERIRLFYDRYPDGRVVTHLRRRTADEVIFEAAVFRGPADALPAATGWACEREGDGEINLVACLENAETSAIGRALANLGFTASAQGPSAEEMANASRARARLTPTFAAASGQAAALAPAKPGAPVSPARAAPLRVLEQPPAVAAPSPIIADLAWLIRRAERIGLRAVRADRWRAQLRAGGIAPDALARLEERLRLWIGRSGERA